MFFYLSFIRPTKDTSDSKVNYFLFVIYEAYRRHFRLEMKCSSICHFPFVIYQADRRHFRLEIKLFSICHLSGRQKTLPTRNEMFFHLSFIRQTEDTSETKVNVLPFVIYQVDSRHFRLESRCSSICHLSGRQKTLPTRN